MAENEANILAEIARPVGIPLIEEEMKTLLSRKYGRQKRAAQDLFEFDEKTFNLETK